MRCTPSRAPSPPGRGARRLLDADAAARHPLLLDARPADRFRGENEHIDPVAGHIPGARSAPALDNLRPDGRFLPPDELAGRMAAVGVRPGDDVARLLRLGGAGGAHGAGAAGGRRHR